MTNTKSTKRALLSSVVALLLCFSMLLGTTYAWFTDSVTSTGNIIKTGTLNVEMYWADGDTDPNAVTWQDASTGAIFESELWEPGYIAARHLKIVNAGTLAMKYQLAIVPNGVVEALADVIDVYYVENATQITDRTALPEKVGTLRDVINGGIHDGELIADDKKTEAVEGVYTATIVLKMREDAGNKYQNMSIGTNFSIRLLATQLASEEDSLDNTYDENAWMEGMVVKSEADLKKALENGGNVVLGADVTSEKGFLLSDPTEDIVLNLNGHTLTVTGEQAKLFSVGGDVDMTIFGGKLVAESTNGQVSGTGTSTGASRAVYFWSSGNLTMTDVEIEGSVRGGHRAVEVFSGNAVLTNVDITTSYGTGVSVGGNGDPQYAPAVAVLNDCDITVTGIYSDPYNSVCFSVMNGGDLTVNSGNYKLINNATYSTGNTHGGWVGIVMNSGGTMTINGGNYENVPADGFNTNYERAVFSVDALAGVTSVLNLNGGTFKPQDDEVYEGSGTVNLNGNKLLEIDGVYHIVPDTTVEADLYILNAEQLVAFAADVNGGNNYAGKTVALINDIDLANVAWAPINGFKGTFNGNGKTISNLTVVADKYAGMFGYLSDSGATVTNLTIDGANVTANTVDTDGYAGAVLGYHYSSGGKLAISDVTVTNSTIIGKNGGAIAGSASMITVSDCVSEKNTINASRNGGIVGTTLESSKVSGCTVSNNTQNVQLFESESAAYVGTIVGRVSGGTIQSDNVTETIKITEASTQDALNNAVKGSAIVTLAAGNYTMPSSDANATITIVGSKDTVLDVTKGAYMDSATVTIEGVTIKTSTGYVIDANGKQGSDYAALYTPNVTYINCTFEGPMRIGRDGAKFIDCTFNSLGNDYIWTYGNDVTFEGCTFNTEGKAILIYSDGGSEVSQVTVKNCVFNSTKGATAGAIKNQNCAAIEIHNYGNGVNLVTSGNTYDANFSGEWRIKTYEANKTQIFVNGVEYTDEALDGTILNVVNSEVQP